MKNKSKVAILMSIRNEEVLIDFNIAYHLDLGFDYIFIANHCSTDKTNEILDSYKDNPRVIVINETNQVFDHAKIINKLLNFANKNFKIDWFAFLDVDEFLSINEKNIHEFVEKLDSKGIPYATIGWANALFDYTHSDYTCSPVNKIDTLKFYYPWPEKKWQEYGHFRKTIIKNHKNIEVVVGGHYVKTGNNLSFFGRFDWNPFIVPFREAKLLHFEFRDTAEVLYEKWQKLAKFENDTTSSDNAPWLERIQTIRKYLKYYKNNIEGINKKWFSNHCTFWGTPIPEDKIIYDNTLAFWYGKYLRRKIEAGKIKSLCLVREGNLGDVVMTEPVARFLLKYVDEIVLATDVANFHLINKTYKTIVPFKNAFTNNNFDATIKLVYEFSDNKKTYIQGFMESIGFRDTLIDSIPFINGKFKNIINERYILVAPHTSNWESKKRNWGYSKFIELANLLENNLNTKVFILKNSHTFREMLSLIYHCEFFIGNDSGPGIISQSFKKKSFIIFGATHPKYLHLSKFATPIFDENKHALCQHKTRQEEIDCCEPFCMDKIRVNKVFGIINNDYEQE